MSDATDYPIGRDEAYADEAAELDRDALRRELETARTQRDYAQAKCAKALRDLDEMRAENARASEVVFGDAVKIGGLEDNRDEWIRKAEGLEAKLALIHEGALLVRGAIQGGDKFSCGLLAAELVDTILGKPMPAPAPVANGLKMIRHGTLPTPSMLFDACKAQDLRTGDVLSVLRPLIMRDRLADAERLLNGLGFGWHAPTVSDLDLDVASVADALADERRAEVSNGRASEDIALKAAAEALDSMRAAENDDGEANEVLP